MQQVIKKLRRKKRHNTYLHFIMSLFIVNKKHFWQNL